MPGSFLKKLPPKPESSFRLKSFIFGRLLSGILHEKGWPANLDSKINMKFLTFQSSLREIHEIWCLNLSAPVVNISNGNTAAIKTQIQNVPENRRFWQLLYKNVQAILMAQHSRKDCGHLRVFLLKHLFCNVFPISEWWAALQISPYQLHTQGSMGTMPSHEILFM